MVTWPAPRLITREGCVLFFRCLCRVDCCEVCSCCSCGARNSAALWPFGSGLTTCRPSRFLGVSRAAFLCEILVASISSRFVRFPALLFARLACDMLPPRCTVLLEEMFWLCSAGRLCWEARISVLELSAASTFVVAWCAKLRTRDRWYTLGLPVLLNWEERQRCSPSMHSQLLNVCLKVRLI